MRCYAASAAVAAAAAAVADDVIGDELPGENDAMCHNGSRARPLTPMTSARIVGGLGVEPLAHLNDPLDVINFRER